MKKRISLTIIIFLVSNIIVFGLFAWSLQRNDKPGAFLRFFDMHAWTTDRHIDLKYNSYYIAGSYHGNLVLGNSTTPLRYIIVTAKADTFVSTISGKLWDTTLFRGPRLYVSDQQKIIFDGSVGAIISMDTATNIPLGKDSSALRFTAMVPVSSGSYIMKLYDDSTDQVILSKQSGGRQSAKFILPKQLDGIFCVDGQLDIAHNTKHLVYCYFYRNQVLVLDSGLNLLKSFNTIDTNSFAKIKIAPVESQDIITLAETPQNVNKRISVDNDRLYVMAGERARNEDPELFMHNSVIDVYNLQTGKYLKSFHLPDLYNSKVRMFKVVDNTLWAIYKRNLVVFNFNDQFGP